MKTNFKPLVIAALMFGTLSGFASESFFYKKEMSAFEKKLNDKKTQSSWTIKDANGNIIHEEKGKAERNEIKDLKLSDGSYTYEYEKGYKITITPVNVKGGETFFMKEASTVIYKPVFRKESNKVLVSQLSLDSEPLHVKIYYEGEVIFDDKVTGGNVLGRVYKLRKDIKGDYKVVMKANDRTYTNEFSL